MAHLTGMGGAPGQQVQSLDGTRPPRMTPGPRRWLRSVPSRRIAPARPTSAARIYRRCRCRLSIDPPGPHHQAHHEDWGDVHFFDPVTTTTLPQCLLAFVLALLMGCATPLPSMDREAIATEAIVASRATLLGRLTQDSTPDSDLSGFRLMPLGTLLVRHPRAVWRAAPRFAGRAVLPPRQRRNAAAWLLRALRDAAERGVRVRLLLDDFYTGGQDDLLLALAAHPNVEVRLFNPFCCARERASATRFVAVGRRLQAPQPPHAQQAVHRRRRDGGDRRAQHGRRVLPAQQRGRTSSTSTPSPSAGRAAAAGAVRPLLEQRRRSTRCRPWRAPTLDAGRAARALRRHGPARHDTAAATAAGQRHPRLRARSPTTSTTAGSA